MAGFLPFARVPVSSLPFLPFEGPVLALCRWFDPPFWLPDPAVWENYFVLPRFQLSSFPPLLVGVVLQPRQSSNPFPVTPKYSFPPEVLNPLPRIKYLIPSSYMQFAPPEIFFLLPPPLLAGPVPPVFPSRGQRVFPPVYARFFPVVPRVPDCYSPLCKEGPGP